MIKHVLLNQLRRLEVELEGEGQYVRSNTVWLASMVVRGGVLFTAEGLAYVAGRLVVLEARMMLEDHASLPVIRRAINCIAKG